MSEPISRIVSARLRARDPTIDIVRGVAIVSMIGANLAYLLAEPHSLFLRYYSTFAAPIFVTLAGVMIALSSLTKSKNHAFSYFLKRALFLVSMGAMIDLLAWGFMPFIGFDVLYLLGFSLPLLYLASNQPRFVVLGLALPVFLLTPLLQRYFGYIEMPLTPSYSDFIPASNISVVVKHWFIDGWFPLFPWLGYGLVGVLIGKWRWQTPQKLRSFASRGPASVAVFLVVAGLIGMYLFPGPLYSRVGFSELFYPATLGFIALSLGVVIGLISIVDALGNLQVFDCFRVFGEASLFMYIVHSLIIGILIESWWPQINTPYYLLFYATLIVFLGLSGWFLRGFRSRYRDMPVMLKWVVGG